MQVLELVAGAVIVLLVIFPRPIYGVAFFTLLALDEVRPITSALSDDELGWLKESVPVTQLWRAALLLVNTESGAARQLDGVSIPVVRAKKAMVSAIDSTAASGW